MKLVHLEKGPFALALLQPTTISLHMLVRIKSLTVALWGHFEYKKQTVKAEMASYWFTKEISKLCLCRSSKPLSVCMVRYHLLQIKPYILCTWIVEQNKGLIKTLHDKRIILCYCSGKREAHTIPNTAFMIEVISKNGELNTTILYTYQIIFKVLEFYFVCMSVFPSCLFVYHMYACCLWRQEEGLDPQELDLLMLWAYI